MNTPTATQIENCVQTYIEDGFGFNSIQEFAEVQFPYHSAAFQKALADAIRAAL